MKQKKGKINMISISSPEHSLKLTNRIIAEVSSNFFDANARNELRKGFEVIEATLQEMEKRDDDFQQLPENRIKALLGEIHNNDALLERNHSQLRKQVQAGLVHGGYPIAGPWWDSYIEVLKLEVDECSIKLEKLVVVTPQFEFQRDERWLKLEAKKLEKKRGATMENLKELEEGVAKVKADIEKQNLQITQRRQYIIKELEELGYDISEFTGEVPDYIG